jgi:hypothetical protein
MTYARLAQTATNRRRRISTGAVFRSPKRGSVRSTEPQRCIPSRFGAGFSRGNGNSHLLTVSRTFEHGHRWRGPRPFERREDTDCCRSRRHWSTRQGTQYVSDVVDSSGAVLTDDG